MFKTILNSLRGQTKPHAPENNSATPSMIECMESRTMLSAASVYTVTFGGTLLGTTASAHRGGINVALADGSVRF